MKRILIFLIAWVFIANAQGLDTTAWQYRIPITIQASMVDADLDSFPFYFPLDSSLSTFWSNVNADGSDIRITKADKVTLCYAQLDTFNFSKADSAGELYWRGDASSTTDTKFYLYYGNSGATASWSTQVWNEQYAAVYHFSENPENGNLQDWTANGNNGTPAGGMDALDLVDGQIGAASAWNFDGINNYVTFPAALNMFFNNTNFTILNIVKTADIQFRLFQTRGTGSFSTERGIQMSVSTADFLNTVISDGLGNYISHQSLPIDDFLNDTWRFLSFDFNNTTGQSKLNFDKNTENSVTESGLIGGNFTGIGAEFGRSNQGTQYFDGQSAEIRILSSVFTKNLKDTFYNNLFNPATFAIAGEIEAVNVQSNNNNPKKKSRYNGFGTGFKGGWRK